MKQKSKIPGPSLQQSMDAAKCLPLHPYLKKYLGYCFFKAAARFRGAMDRQLAQFGIVGPHFGMMVLIREMGPQTQVELGQQMGMDKATMVRMIDGLEAKKFLKRVTTPEDRRAKRIELTPQGLQAINKMDEARKRAEKEMLGNLTAAEREQLRDIVMKILATPFRTD
jgi:DNA-binding MarR family transcriptional regulator